MIPALEESQEPIALAAEVKVEAGLEQEQHHETKSMYINVSVNHNYILWAASVAEWLPFWPATSGPGFDSLARRNTCMAYICLVGSGVYLWQPQQEQIIIFFAWGVPYAW